VIIHLDRIHDEPFHWSETVSVEADEVDAVELLSLSEISWAGRVERAASGHRFVARLEYEQAVCCTRCLKTLSQPIVAEADLLLRVQPADTSAAEIRLAQEDLDVLALDDERLDTEPILKEQLQLNVPMRALCSEDCAGLCPRCGADRNETPDCCEDRVIDPRWQALEDLRGS
jgi:uncharacterized protein